MRAVTLFYLSLTLFVYWSNVIFTIYRINDGLINRSLSLSHIIIDSIVSVYIIYRFWYIKKIHGLSFCIKILIIIWNIVNLFVITDLIMLGSLNDEKKVTKFLSKYELRTLLFYYLITILKFYLYIISCVRIGTCAPDSCNGKDCWQKFTIKEEHEEESEFNDEKRLKEIKEENKYLKLENQRLKEEKIKVDNNNIRNKKIEILIKYIKSKYNINIPKDSLFKKLLLEIKDKYGLIIDSKKYEEIIINYIKQNIFKFLKCPLSNKLFNNPFITPDGQTFDNNEIKEEIKKTGLNPITNKELKQEKLIKNKLVLEIVEIINNHEDDFNIQHFKEIRQKLISNKTKKLFENPYVIHKGEDKGNTEEENKGFNNFREYPNLVIKNMIEHNLEIFDDNFLKFNIEFNGDFISNINSDVIKYNIRSPVDKQIILDPKRQLPSKK